MNEIGDPQNQSPTLSNSEPLDFHMTRIYRAQMQINRTRQTTNHYQKFKASTKKPESQNVCIPVLQYESQDVSQIVIQNNNELSQVKQQRATLK